jgi:hypothetical protein
MGDVGDFFSDLGSDLFGGDSWFGENIIDPIQELGESVYKPLAGEPTTGQKEEQQKKTNEAQAAADARIRQAEYEEQAAKGAARSRALRRRGFSSTVLTGGPSALGGTSLADSGKTLLGN